MSNEFKILPGQVTQLTQEGPTGGPQGWRGTTGRRRSLATGAETRIEGPARVSDWMTPTGTCQRCGERPATVVWAPDGTMGAIHGGYQHWCNRCALREQVAHARECANKLPGLERQLMEEER